MAFLQALTLTEYFNQYINSFVDFFYRHVCFMVVQLSEEKQAAEKVLQQLNDQCFLNEDIRNKLSDVTLSRSVVQTQLDEQVLHKSSD